MLAYGRQKPAYSHFVARIFRKILAEQLTHFIRKLLWGNFTLKLLRGREGCSRHEVAWILAKTTFFARMMR